MLCLAAIGIASFAIFDALGLLVLARALIGAGLAGRLMASYQCANLWLPARLVPLACGLFPAAGGLGALAATHPVRLLMEFWQWNEIFSAVAAIVVVIDLTIFIFTPDLDQRRRTTWAECLRSIPVAAVIRACAS